MNADLAFYCVADERYFPGAVGMINSLRLVGHGEPIFVLDCGLRADQCRRLEAEATVVDGPRDRPPWLVKTIAPLRHPARLKVLIDTDMVVTRSLAPLIEMAASGQVVAFRDRQQRFFPQWGELLDLGDAQPRPYVSSGLLCVDDSIGAEVLRLMDERGDHVDFERTFWRRNDREYPFLYADQDVLNAILATRVEPDRVVALDERLAATPPFRRLRVVDETELRCSYRDGTEPYLLHQFVRKPWLERTYHGPYSRLLARLLLGGDVAVRLDESELPLRMRSGLLARGDRALVNVADLGRWYLGDRLPGWLGTRVEATRRRLMSGL